MSALRAEVERKEECRCEDRFGVIRRGVQNESGRLGGGGVETTVKRHSSVKEGEGKHQSGTTLSTSASHQTEETKERQNTNTTKHYIL